MLQARCALLLALGVFAATPALAQRVTEEIEVRVINVDVIVTDRSGTTVPALKREDFQLFEDGQPVEIKYFSRIDDGEMQLDGEPGQTAVEPDDLAGVRTPVMWVVFIDQTNMRPQRRNLALRQLQAFFRTALEEGDKAMVASIDGQAFRVRQNVTGDRKMVLDALKSAERERVHNGPAQLEKSQIKADIARAEPEDREYEAIAEALAHRINFLIQDEVKRTRNAIAAMGALLDLLSRVDERVALMYVGAGFNTLPGSELEQAWQVAFSHVDSISRLTRPSAEIHRPMLELDVKRLFDRLSGSRITLYSISPGESGLTSVEESGITAYATVAGARAAESEVLGDRAAIAEASVGREMASRTGGLTFKANSALSRQLGAVRKDLNDYYSLGYVPTGDPGRTRSIRVKVNAPGARLRYREAARERTRWEEAGNDIVAALVAPHQVIRAPLVARNPVVATEKKEQANPLGIEVEAERPQRDVENRGHLLPFKFNMELDALTFQRRGSSHTAHLVFRFALAGPDGTLWPLESREQLLSIPQGEVPANADAIAYSWHLDLGPLHIPPDVPLRRGGMKLNVTVEDRATNVRSVITVPVPKPGRG
jgi:VWFA-related protein